MKYRFGVFSFDDRTLALTRSDRPVPLEPQPARALALLVARAGELITRDELRAHLWDPATHVDFDRGLAYCIGELRAALGDSAENPRFVQTLPRRGFTFIAPVTRDPATEPREAPAAERDAAAVPRDAAPEGARARPVVVKPWIAAAAIAGAALIVGAAGALMVARDRPPAPPRRPIVAVAVFENETGDAQYDRLAASIADVIVERLTAIGPSRLGVDGNAAILRRPRGARDWRAVAQDTGAAYLVFGLLQERADRLSLLMQLIRLDDGTHVWVQRINRPSGDRLDMIDADAAAQIESAVRSTVLK
ncbi:MAG TPA: winged helix-turn-helix domain-containing protein [Vicinamibacterales bacterium]|nr:winged helix-turn-helix domain-containing protein [Vicinamibacterales bacterium]